MRLVVPCEDSGECAGKVSGKVRKGHGEMGKKLILPWDSCHIGVSTMKRHETLRCLRARCRCRRPEPGPVAGAPGLPGRAGVAAGGGRTRGRARLCAQRRLGRPAEVTQGLGRAAAARRHAGVRHAHRGRCRLGVAGVLGLAAALRRAGVDRRCAGARAVDGRRRALCAPCDAGRREGRGLAHRAVRRQGLGHTRSARCDVGPPRLRPHRHRRTPERRCAACQHRPAVVPPARRAGAPALRGAAAWPFARAGLVEARGACAGTDGARRPGLRADASRRPGR